MKLLNAVAQHALRLPTAALVRDGAGNNVVVRSNASSPAIAATKVSISSRAIALAGQTDLSPATAARQATVLPVDYTNNIKLTGNKTLDPLLAAGNHWWHSTTILADGANPAASADHVVTYSFMAAASSGNSSGFAALDAAKKDVVKSALDYISTVVNITFTEDAGGSGQIKIGSNAQQLVSAGYASYPNDPNGGEVYLANDASTFSNAASWDKGGYTWETILHEIGHALGLKHPGNYNAGGGGTPKPYLAAALDNRSNSIMSYKNDLKHMHVVESTGGGMTAYDVNPDSYQAFDIAALQYLYGAASTAAPNTYAFADDQAFSRTLFDKNSGSKIDLSGMVTRSVLDLRGGHFSSIGIVDPYAATGLTKAEYTAATSGGVKLSKLLGIPTYSGTNNLAIAKGSRIQTAIGGQANDTLISGTEIGGTANLDGGAGDDSFFVASGNAAIADASGSNDTVYVVKKAGTAWALSADHSTLTQTSIKTGATLATINISGVEHVGFWNGTTAKAAGKPLFSPLQQPNTAVYVANSKPVTSPQINVIA